VFRIALAIAPAALLAACSGMANQVGSSSAFVDPARYKLYSCAQLETAYTETARRELELARRRAKAKEGAAGGLMAELGYGPDFLTARANREQIEVEMDEKNCDRSRIGQRESVSGPAQ